MTRKELRDVLDEAVGKTPRVDLAEAAWAQGVGMRRRRRAAFAGGGTVLAAAAVVGALVISGGIAPDEDVAPALPTSTPGPTQVEPGPVDLSQARTYLFHRAGTPTDLETSSLEVLSGQDAPLVADLAGSSWELTPMDPAGDQAGFIEIDLAGSEDVGAVVPTTLSFVEAEDGDTLLSVGIDECGGATFQEDLEVAADGRFAGQSAGTDDQGCSENVQAAEDFWMEVLLAGGWLHQPDEDVLLLSVVVPEPVKPSPAPTAEVAGDLADARTLAFRRPGTDTEFDVEAVPPLEEQQVPSVEDLSGTTWELIPIDQPWYSEGPNEVSGIHILEAEDFGAADQEVQGPLVPTEVQFEADSGGVLLSIHLADCGGGSYREPLDMDAEGRFAGQQPFTRSVECEPAVQTAEDVWMELLPQGGWLHQPSDDVLLLSIVPPEGLLPEPLEDVPPEPTTEDPGPADAPAPPEGTASIGGGYGVVLPEGWTDIPLRRSSDTEADSTCLLPEGETELFYPHCTAGVEIRTGVDPDAASANEGGWWNPGESDEGRPSEECHVARLGYGPPDNPVTFAPDPETGSTTIDGHPVEWSRWSATCADGQEFTADAWRVIDLGIELRSMDGSQEVEPILDALVLNEEFRTDRQIALQVTEPIGDTLTGERQRWAGAYLDTGEMLTFQITEDTRCLITKPEGLTGVDLQLGDRADLEDDLVEYPVVNVIVNPDGEVVTVHAISVF